MNMDRAVFGAIVFQTSIVKTMKAMSFRVLCRWNDTLRPWAKRWGFTCGAGLVWLIATMVSAKQLDKIRRAPLPPSWAVQTPLQDVPERPLGVDDEGQIVLPWKSMDRSVAAAVVQATATSPRAASQHDALGGWAESAESAPMVLSLSASQDTTKPVVLVCGQIDRERCVTPGPSEKMTPIPVEIETNDGVKRLSLQRVTPTLWNVSVPPGTTVWYWAQRLSPASGAVGSTLTIKVEAAPTPEVHRVQALWNLMTWQMQGVMVGWAIALFAGIVMVNRGYVAWRATRPKRDPW